MSDEVARQVVADGSGKVIKSARRLRFFRTFYLLPFFSFFFCCPVCVRFVSDVASAFMSGIWLVGLIFLVITYGYDRLFVSG